MTREEAVKLSTACFSSEWILAKVKKGKIYYSGMYFSNPSASYYEGQTLKFYIVYDIKFDRFQAIRTQDEIWLEERNKKTY